jgi:hypothetical protein
LLSIVGVALGVILILFSPAWRAECLRVWQNGRELESGKRFHASGRDGVDQLERFGQRDIRERLLEIEGVQSTVPVIRYIHARHFGRWGIASSDGVDWQPLRGNE